MKSAWRILFAVVIGVVSLTVTSMASVIFKPSAKAKFVPPSEEITNANAQQLFEKGQKAEEAGNLRGAIKAYSSIIRRYPKDALAPGAAYKRAQLLEQTHDFLKAADTYRLIVEKYPKFEHFDDAIEAQFRIGEMYLGGKKQKLLGIPLLSALDHAVDVFAAIVRTAPYGKYTARAQFDIGLAREKQGNDDAAIQAYEAVVDKFPNDPIAAEAQYQIGYIWLEAARTGTKDAAATKNAQRAFEDFLYRHGNSEKAAQAREDLRILEHKQTTNSFEVAKFYDKQKNYRAAVIYYNEVIRQQPGSPEGDHAKKRVDEIRAKIGDAALQPALIATGPTKSKHGSTASAKAQPEGPMPNLPPDAAPLPPPDADVSLPPPASLLPDTTTAPAVDASPRPGESAAPEPAASPEPSASPH